MPRSSKACSEVVCHLNNLRVSRVVHIKDHFFIIKCLHIPHYITIYLPHNSGCISSSFTIPIDSNWGWGNAGPESAAVSPFEFVALPAKKSPYPATGWRNTLNLSIIYHYQGIYHQYLMVGDLPCLSLPWSTDPSVHCPPAEGFRSVRRFWRVDRPRRWRPTIQPANQSP